MLFIKSGLELVNEARKLKVLDISNIDSARLNNSKVISIFDRIKTNIDNNEPLMTNEVFVYTQILVIHLIVYLKKCKSLGS